MKTRIMVRGVVSGDGSHTGRRLQARLCAKSFPRDGLLRTHTAPGGTYYLPRYINGELRCQVIK